MTRWISAALTAVIVVGGFATLSWATDGWTAWTAEAARRRAVLTDPRPLANVVVQRESGERTSLHAFDQPILVIDFIFTRCPTVCLAMGYEFRQIQSRLASMNHHRGVQLLSVSFDHDNDGPPQLSAYLDRFAAERSTWSALRVEDKEALNELLDSLGVVVLPEPTLGFVHNAALYLVKDHAVIGIYDVDDRNALMARLLTLIEGDDS